MCDNINLKIAKLSEQLPAQRTYTISNMFYAYLILCCVLFFFEIKLLYGQLQKLAKQKKRIVA